MGFEGAEYCRGYIKLCQGIGYDAEPISEESAQKILSAADQILRAGPTEQRTASRIREVELAEKQKAQRANARRKIDVGPTLYGSAPGPLRKARRGLRWQCLRFAERVATKKDADTKLASVEL